MPPRFQFTVHATDGKARTGEIAMRRGVIRTPAFMPVGTAATVKAMKPADVRASGADIILGNTYHLMLRPTAERVARLGGLHAFMGWDRPILTDSGGYQVMSLSRADQARRERGRVQEPPRRHAASDEPRTVDGDPAAARLGHRHGVRRIGADHLDQGGAGGGDGAVDALGDSGRARRSLAAASMPKMPRSSASSRARSTRRCAARARRR